MKNVLTFLLCLAASLPLFSQSNIQQTLSVNPTGTAAHASAQLDVSATDKGMLVPRMTTAQRNAIGAPAPPACSCLTRRLAVFGSTTAQAG